MESLLAQIRAIGAVAVDPWVVVDANANLIEYNAHFRALFSRQQARNLQGRPCCNLLKLSVCDGDQCLAKQCLAEGQPVRYDEIPAAFDGDAGVRQVIVSATPLRAEDGTEVCFMLVRDVSDAATVQRKYKSMLEQETKEKERLREEIRRKTKELMDTNTELNRTQKELMRFKKGLLA